MKKRRECQTGLRMGGRLREVAAEALLRGKARVAPLMWIVGFTRPLGSGARLVLPEILNRLGALDDNFSFPSLRRAKPPSLG